jgi:hypothetical protein
MKPDDIFIPGRLSWVYFNHKYIVDFLHDKPKGWFRDTAGGFFGANGFGSPVSQPNDEGGIKGEAVESSHVVEEAGSGRAQRMKIESTRYGSEWDRH